MESSAVKDASESDITPPATGAEVYQNEDNNECREKHDSKTVYCNTIDDVAEFFSNRAEAHFVLGNYKESLSDARVATKLQPSLIKAIITGVNACLELKHFEEAIIWCKKGLVTERKDSTSPTCTDKAEGSAETKAIDDELFLGEDCQHRVCNRTSQKKANGILGIIALKLSDYKTARDYFELELSEAKDAGDRDREQAAYTNLGAAYHSLGDFKISIKFHQQALSIAKDIGSKDSEGNAYINLGVGCNSLGDFNNAIEFLQQAISIAKERGDKDDEQTAYIYLGNAYYSLGDLKNAIELYQQALSIAKEVGHEDAEVGGAYNNLGAAYHSLGDFNNAIKFHQHALSIAKKVGGKDLEGIAYNNLGNAYHSLRDFENAIEFHQKALSIAEKVGAKDAEVKAYSNLGSDYRILGDFKTAIEFYQQALNICKELGSKDSEGSIYVNFGSVYHSLGEFKSAIECHEQAINIAEEVGNKVTAGEAYMNLGYVNYCTGDVSRAENSVKASVRLFDEIRALLRSEDEWKISLRDQHDWPYSNLWRLQLLQDKTTEALFTAEQGRAQALMDLMESQYGVKSALLASEEQMEIMSGISSYIQSLTIFLAKTSNLVNFWVLQKGGQCQFVQKEINNNLESLIDETYKEIDVFRSIMCENRSLDESSDEESEEFPDRSPKGKELTSSEGKGDALKKLSDVLIGSISRLLIQDDELIIVPDGSLLLVPYAALVDSNSRYLSETVSIRLVLTLTSLKLMAECPDERHTTSSALLVGDPWVETVCIDKKKFKQLPSAKKEVEMIGKILMIDPLIEKSATKAEVLSRLNSVDLVHIAAHGRAETGEIILSPNPASSKTPKKKDYLLTMADVLNAKLHARLVVLSCCHSGRGKIKAEGVVGIARAFLGAGARSVIASLWAIDDDATQEFMRKFYEHLMEGQSASKSLNQAMKWMRESKDFSAVKYWAPFVLIGDDVTFNFGQSSNVSVQ